MSGHIELSGLKLRIYRYNTLVVGSGAAGLNAADRLHAFGQQDVAVLTEGVFMGTSHNAGSDKQTYYKLTMAGEAPDSVMEMAKTLFNGGAMHGDLALVEAALSARCFFRLVELGVPFPQDRFGEFVGYKTDHDPRQRATSAGPLTSRFMTEKLFERIQAKTIPVHDGLQAVRALTDRARQSCLGILALDLNALEDPDRRYVLFNCANVIYAVGGPAGMYADSVYPLSQTGGSGIAFEAGVRGQNLTESQFGLSSIAFRWNVSGTYQQVLPRYISTGADGQEEREFLLDYFSTPGSMLNAVFLKGYQWPFDVRKAGGEGSSLVDLCVYHQRVHLGRRVFLDYRRNPLGDGFDFSLLNEEARSYLEKSGATFGSPLDRLAHMNQPAIDLYSAHGIDLSREPLEIAVCAQHTNGGLWGNHWWESNVRHFFPVGEANGSHGIYRPGGAALNAGQVGGTRAARFIAAKYSEPPCPDESFLQACGQQIQDRIGLAESLLRNRSAQGTARSMRQRIGRRMSANGAILRSAEKVNRALAEARSDLAAFARETVVGDPLELPAALRNHDLLICQITFLAAIQDYLARGGGSRGSFIVSHASGEKPSPRLPEEFRALPEDERLRAQVQVIEYGPDECAVRWDPVRPLPSEDQWFENVWRRFQRDGNVS